MFRFLIRSFSYIITLYYLVSIALADVPCANSPILAICSSSCSNLYCGWNLPLLGHKSYGKFVTYVERGKKENLTIRPGQSIAEDYMRFRVTTEGSSLIYAQNEFPDFCCRFRVKQIDGNFDHTIKGDANDHASIELPVGSFMIIVTHEINAPGGVDGANYVPLVTLLPTVKSDSAGDNRHTARFLGELNIGGSLSEQGTLEFIETRFSSVSDIKFDGIDNRADWFRITIPKSGLLMASLEQTNILDDSGKKINIGIISSETQQFPAPLPENGAKITPGTHYVTLSVPNDPFNEFGIAYKLHLRLLP